MFTKKGKVSSTKATLDKWFSLFIRLRDSDANGYGRCISCGNLCISKLMISQAVRAWKGMYRRQFRSDDSSFLLLQKMEHHISELMNEYFKRETGLREDVNLSTVDTVRQAEENVIKEILKFLKEYDNSNRNQQ